MFAADGGIERVLLDMNACEAMVLMGGGGGRRMRSDGYSSAVLEADDQW
jgi:hypothetical protein